MLIDTHAHVNFNAFLDDHDEVIGRSLDGNVWMINIGSQYATSQKAVDLAEKYSSGVYAAVGLHPIHLAEGIFKVKLDEEESASQNKNEQFDYEAYKKLAQSKKVVAIGECGLDYYYRPKTKIKMEQFRERQKKVLLQQMDLAQELDLPIIFHCRMAHQELIQTIQQSNNPTRGVIHCFTGTWQEAQKYMELGLHIGFNGIIFKFDVSETINKIPLEKVLIETDCPYLTPPLPAEALAKAGSEPIRNEPLFVKYVAEEIAKIKNLNYQEIKEATTKNAKELFKL